MAGDRPTRKDMDNFVARCISLGWTVRSATHPKTVANWLRKGAKAK